MYTTTGDAPSAGRGGRRAGRPEQPGEEREQEGARAAGQAGKEAPQEEQGRKHIWQDHINISQLVIDCSI